MRPPAWGCAGLGVGAGEFQFCDFPADEPWAGQSVSCKMGSFSLRVVAVRIIREDVEMNMLSLRKKPSTVLNIWERDVHARGQ